MRLLLISCFCLVVFACSRATGGQNYVVKPGEMVMKLVVAGRGNIFVHLYNDKTPKTTGHIAELAKNGFYDGQRFHKVVRSPRPFIAQIGDPASKSGNLDDPNMGGGGTGTKIPYEESGISHEEGTVALASPPKDKNAGDCQFFFVLGSSKFLDGKYTVFGKVVEGLDVMRTLQKGDRVESMTIISK